MKIFRPSGSLQFFASLKLAVLCILGLAAILSVATVVESYYGMRAAHVMVYGTYWFFGVLFLLALNVFCAALSRFPWKKHQTGFVITHAGILILLAGSALTMLFGVDGNLAIVEKSENNEVVLNDLVLSVSREDGSSKETFRFPETGRAAQGRLFELKVAPEEKIVATRFFPRVQVDTQMEASPVSLGLPAVQVELYNDRFQLAEWIVAESPDRRSEVNLGPARISLVSLWDANGEKEFLAPPKNDPARDSKGLLTIESATGKESFRIEEALQKWRKLASNGIELRIEKYLPYAVVDGKDLVSRSNEPVNPAIQLWARDRQGRIEKHTVFANFPDFETLHERALPPSQKKMGLKMRFIAGEKTREAKQGQLQLALAPDRERLLYRVLSKAGDVNGQGQSEVGKSVETGWMDLQFRVKEWLPSAVRRFVPRYVDQISGGDSGFLSALEVEVQGTTRSAPVWLIEGMSRRVASGAGSVVLLLGKSRLELPFKVFLEKFTMGMDPGTTKAASYESLVVVKDPTQGIEKRTLISMNEPLKYGGFTLYQASYQLEEGKPPVSVLSVNRDPGRMVKYAGALVMVFGICLMFYMNPHYWGKILGKRKVDA